ncbi:metallophosphoesterase family protein [Archangium lansingense]|uniref:Metallophosphoesterase n=1 Tax=Archangium lansingense TaxID=2995310 RepID=A0ABT3ZUZ0_9BACT|nr:metallophosphoesterase [Archangium lansinium]MCY1073227.1 metallophosphoesterase [Archangium lansinium]
MPKVPSTARHPALSLWQSCLHRVLSRKAGARDAVGLESSVEHPAMEEASAAAQEHAPSHEVDVPPSRRQRASACARLCARLALARFHGDHEEVQRLMSELRFTSCDPLWVESLVEYERALLLHHQPFYRRHTSLADFVLPALPDEATVALLADWGTGMPDARALLEQLSTFQPDAILHLGDIYYSGTPHEVRAHFLDVFTRVFGSRWPRVLALSGNHDRYSGGEGYRVLLEGLGQPASYFCLRNRYWQLLGMDTGLHDFNPRALADTVTWLEDSEVDWLLDKVRNAEGRGTVLLSHHPLFSLASVGHDAEGRKLALNPRLGRALASILGEVSLWFWGHEHNLHIYEPYAGLARGRCIGAGAVPVLLHEQHNSPIPGLVPAPGESGPPRHVPGTRLGNDGFLDHHAYAILSLRGPQLTVRYFQMENRLLVPGHVPAPGPALHEETVTLSTSGAP